MRNRQQQERIVSIWNRKHPVGTTVEYDARRRNGELAQEFKTRSPAWLLGDKTAVVLLEGRTGAVSIEHCTPVVAAPVEHVPA